MLFFILNYTAESNASAQPGSGCGGKSNPKQNPVLLSQSHPCIKRIKYYKDIIYNPHSTQLTCQIKQKKALMKERSSA